MEWVMFYFLGLLAYPVVRGWLYRGDSRDPDIFVIGCQAVIWPGMVFYLLICLLHIGGEKLADYWDSLDEVDFDDN